MCVQPKQLDLPIPIEKDKAEKVIDVTEDTLSQIRSYLSIYEGGLEKDMFNALVRLRGHAKKIKKRIEIERNEKIKKQRQGKDDIDS